MTIPLAAGAAAIELGSTEFWDHLGRNPAWLAAQVCSIDVAKLDETIQRHPALRAWVNASHEAAKIYEERMRWELTKARAVARMTLRRSEENKGMTVGDVEAIVETNESVIAANARLIEAQDRRGGLRAMADALEDRLQMIIQISAKQRAEMRDFNR